MSETNFKSTGYDSDNEIKLRELFDSLIEQKSLIIGITAFFAIGSLIYSFFLTDLYRSEAILSLKDESSTSTKSRLNSVAQLTGLNLASQSENKGAVVTETVKSRDFVKHLITFEDVLPGLMAYKAYNKGNGIITFDDSKYISETKKWINTPSLMETHKEYVRNVVSIYQDKADTGFIYVSVTHPSPTFSKFLLELIVQEMNELVRQRDLKESENALSYLKNELSNTKLIEMKQSINLLIQSQLETQMMAKIGNDYVFRIIEPPFLPEEKVAPRKKLITFLGTSLGFILASIYILMSMGLGFKPEGGFLSLSSAKRFLTRK